MIDSNFYWYKLFSTKGVGNKSLYYIHDFLEKENLTLEKLMKFSKYEFQNILRSLFQNKKLVKINYELLHKIDDEKMYDYYQKLRQNDISIISLENENYPLYVKTKLGDDSPAILFCKGYLNLLNSTSVAIVGSRNLQDKHTSDKVKSISGYFAVNGVNVISGYAKGVDTLAHIGALENEGTTSFVLSHGLNYLSVKKEVFNFDWGKNGLFISQFAPGEKFSGYNAMKRNKLVCALSKAVVVVSSGPEKDELGKMSGTFDAGKSALKMGIPLFVLSPRIFRESPKGSSTLIQMGGIEFENEKDLFDMFKNRIEVSNRIDSNNAIKVKREKSKSSTQINMFNL